MDRSDHEEVKELDEIVQAFHAIDAAERRYREILRMHLKAKTVQQVEVSKALNRTREMIRRDAMTDEERAELRRAESERKRALRGISN